MNTVKIIAIICLVVYLLILLVIAKLAKSPAKTVRLYVLLGVVAYIAINLTAKYTGVHIPINPWSVGTCVAGGLPGVILMLVLNMLIV